MGTSRKYFGMQTSAGTCGDKTEGAGCSGHTCAAAEHVHSARITDFESIGVDYNRCHVLETRFRKARSGCDAAVRCVLRSWTAPRGDHFQPAGAAAHAWEGRRR